MLAEVPGNPSSESSGLAGRNGQGSLVGSGAGKGCGDRVQVRLDPRLQAERALVQLVHVQPGRMINEHPR